MNRRSLFGRALAWLAAPAYLISGTDPTLARGGATGPARSSLFGDTPAVDRLPWSGGEHGPELVKHPLVKVINHVPHTHICGVVDMQTGETTITLTPHEPAVMGRVRVGAPYRASREVIQR